ncbi:A24 family peptidase [Vreelandella sp. EE22]
MTPGLLILLVWVLAVGYRDLRTRRIDNRLAYPFLLLAAGWLAVTGESLIGVAWPQALFGVGSALLLAIPGHVKGVLGGGDVKLLAALGLCLGTTGLLAVVALTAALLVVWHTLARRLPARTRAALAHYAPGICPPPRDHTQDPLVQGPGDPGSGDTGYYAYAPFIALALVLLVLGAISFTG